MTPDKVEAALGVLRDAADCMRAVAFIRTATAPKVEQALSVLTEALAESRRDAARYRWLRDSQQTATHSSWLGVYPADSRCCYYGLSLDAKVDAAMKETP